VVAVGRPRRRVASLWWVGLCAHFSTARCVSLAARALLHSACGLYVRGTSCMRVCLLVSRVAHLCALHTAAT
jgi:hypothetical protein